MKLPAQALAIFTACALAAGPLRAQDDVGAPPPPDNGGPSAADSDNPDNSASFQTFYDTLGSQGTWIQTSDYGYVWQPEVTDPDWAPYTDGHWVYTDDGWTWVSDEPWGWATYHYGRWVNLDGTGWCWVPGYTWAPAWVAWRYGDDYCGWAPLPPDSFVGIDYFGDGLVIGVGFHIGGDCDNIYGIGAGWYHFVPVSRLGDASYHGHYVDPHNNFALINRTTNVTNINVTHNAAGGGATPFVAGGRSVTVGGPSLAQVNAVSQTPVQQVSLVRTSQPGGGGTLANHSLALFAPRVSPASSPGVRPGRVAGSLGQATINRGTDIAQPLAVNARLAPSPATQEEVQQARVAQSQAPARAKVVTASTPVNPVLEAPLTSFRPVSETIPERGQYRSSNGEFAPATEQVVPTVRTAPVSSGVEEERTPSRVYEAVPTYPTPSATQPHFVPNGAPGQSTYHQSVVPSVSPATTSGNSRSAGGNAGGGEGNRSTSSSGGSSSSNQGGGSYQGGGSSSGGNRQQQSH